MAVFQQYDWPGNIRELRNLIERLMIMVPGPVIDPAQTGLSLQARPVGSTSQPFTPAVHPLFTQSYDSLRDARNAFEKDYIARKRGSTRRPWEMKWELERCARGDSQSLRCNGAGEKLEPSLE